MEKIRAKLMQENAARYRDKERVDWVLLNQDTKLAEKVVKKRHNGRLSASGADRYIYFCGPRFVRAFILNQPTLN